MKGAFVMNEIFGEIATDQVLEELKSELYRIGDAYYAMHDEVSHTRIGLEDLLRVSQKAQTAIKYAKDRETVELIKKEMDKIAVLIEGFVNQFKPIYDEITTVYIAEKLAGTFDKKHEKVEKYHYGLDTAVSVPFSSQGGWKSKRSNGGY
jgi:hypothetical protein